MITSKTLAHLAVSVATATSVLTLPAPGTNAAGGLAVFPGAEGFGTQTKAGRGGKLVAVTSVADSGPGTLRAALEDPAPKIIIFRVGGIIELKSLLFVKYPFVTIAGQTAPGDGILLKDFGIVIVTNDVLIQSIRVRPGNRGAIRPDHNKAIVILGPQEKGLNGHHVVLDHVSASWGEDETITTWSGAHDVTISWSIVSEALNRSRHAKGTHSAGLLIGDRSDHVSAHHNLLAHNDFRNPLIISGGTHDFINNVIFNWGSLVTEIIDDAAVAVNVVGNVYRPGPSSKTPYEIVINPSGKGFVPQIFAAGNSRSPSDTVPENGWTMVQYGWKGNGAPEKYRSNVRVPGAQIQVSSARDTFEQVLEGAGARAPRRDGTDERIVRDVRNGTGRIIDSPDEVGGYPSYSAGVAPLDSDGDGMPDEWERHEGLNPRNASDGNTDLDGDGYTNVEEYLHSLMLMPARPSAH
jgi:pectate lyase